MIEAPPKQGFFMLCYHPAMKISDGRGNDSIEAIQFAAERPDLPDCSVCENGTACYCVMRSRSMADEERADIYDEPIACACMGFIGCSNCDRQRSGFVILG